MNEMISYNSLFDRDVLIVLLLIFSLSLVFLILLSANRRLNKSVKKLELELAELKKYSEIHTTYLSQYNDHFNILDLKLKSLEEITSITNRDISMMAEGITGEVGVGKAIELARRGATVDEILESSDIQKDQAELIVKFHGTSEL